MSLPHRPAKLLSPKNPPKGKITHLLEHDLAPSL